MIVSKNNIVFHYVNGKRVFHYVKYPERELKEDIVSSSIM